jgi:fucose permease
MINLILLFIIYLAFISLGLPDALLGVAWPAIRADWGLPLDALGLVAILITGSTILSSLMSGTIIQKFGTGKVTFISCLMTGSALFGMSQIPSFGWLLILAIPLGLGGGSVDAALNNYVSLHFKAHHMNWLHAFWGIGATLGPLAMANALVQTGRWQTGYKGIAIFQLTLATFLLVSLPLWGKHQAAKTEERPGEDKRNSPRDLISTPGVPLALMTFLLYCAVEVSVGLWGSSYLTQVRGFSIEKAAGWVSAYYGGITIGRMISGFISFKLSNTQMIRAGLMIALSGAILLATPLPSGLLAGAMVLMGLGLAPIFPSMLHETPKRFGPSKSQSIIGYQMAAGYFGSALVPPAFGLLVRATNLAILPYFLSISLAVILLVTERLQAQTMPLEVHS